MPPRLRPGPAWAALLLTLAVRALVALSRADEWQLDVYSGSLAWALVQGMPLDPDSLPIIPHSRGSVVIAGLLVPLYALFGPAFWGLKAVALALSGATAFLFARILERHAGTAAAWAGALLFALLPPSYQVVDVLALGSHGDVNLLVLGNLALLLGLGAAALWSPGRALLLGLFCGLGYFCSLQFLAAVPALGLAWLAAAWRSRGEVRAHLAWVWAGPLAFALPLLPAWLLADRVTASDKIVSKSLGERVLPDGIGGAAEKWLGTWGHELRRSWLFEEHGGAPWSWLYLAALAAGLLLLVPRLRRLEPLALFALAHPLLVVTLYAVTDFRLNLVSTADGLGSRYVMPVVVSTALWIALGAGRLHGAGRRVPALLLMAAPLAAGAAGVASMADPGRAAAQPPLRGTEFARFKDHFEHAGGDDLGARLAWIEELDPDWSGLRPLCYEKPLLRQLAWNREEELRADLRAALTAPADLRRYQLAALGFHAADRWAQLRGPEGAALERLVATARLLEGEDRTWFLRGAGKGWVAKMVARRVYEEAVTGGRLPGGPRWEVKNPYTTARLMQLPEELRRPIAEGLGFQIGFRTTPYARQTLQLLGDREALGVLAPELRAALFDFVGRGYRVRFREALYEPPEPGALRLEAHLAPGDRPAFRAGLRPDREAAGGGGG